MNPPSIPLAQPLLGAFTGTVAAVVTVILIGVAMALLVLIVRCYRKIEQGSAGVRNGWGNTAVSFSGIVVFPVIHRFEIIDISLKRIEIFRHGEEGLICKDNIRADIKVAFFVRVNKTEEDVLKVAQAVGCARASNRDALVELFDAKFSEALKTAGKQFEFAELYSSRDTFKEAILKVIGTDLNGFVLDDAAIDFLEQTPIEKLNERNILDAEGIKKITQLTAEQRILANQIERHKEKTIEKEDVEAREAILELKRQLAESEERQKREIAAIQARETAEARKVTEEERLKAEAARINTDQEIGIAEQNRLRQILVAEKNKERTAAIEQERVERDRLLEATERERIVTLAQIERDKILETERRNIQEVIRERVELEKTVVAEQERIRDTEAFAAAEREKRVQVTQAEMEAERGLVREIKAAEAARRAAELKAEEEKVREVVAAQAAREASQLRAEERLIAAEAEEKAAARTAEAQRHSAEGRAALAAADGLAEAQVLRAKAEATEEQGTAEANVLRLKAQAEAQGIHEKAEAMKVLNEAGRDHEEFKLRLNKERDIELAEIHIRQAVAEQQARIVAEALRNAKIDIVGGETAFFDKIVGAVTQGKAVDRLTHNSRVLSDVKDTFFNGDPEYFKSRVARWIDDFGFQTADIKNLTVAALLGQMLLRGSADQRNTIEQALETARRLGLADLTVAQIRPPAAA